MELNGLRIFFEVARAGSFTAAARHLNISQSALSRSVALLEQSVGVKLLERSKSGVSLTPTGSEVYQKSDTIFRACTEIETHCRGIRDKIEGPLNIGASDHVANYLLVPILHKMTRQYPGLAPRLHSGTPERIVDQMLKNEIDLGLFFTRVNTTGVRYEPVTAVPMAVVCHPALPARKSIGAPAYLRRLIEETGFIGSLGIGSRPLKELANMLGQAPRVTFAINSQEAQKRACLEGAGVAYLARFMVQREIEAGTLVEIPLKSPISLQLFLATRRGRQLPLVARAFLRDLQIRL